MHLQRQYSEWIVRAKRTIVHVLEDLPSFKPPLDNLLELLPRLQARYYSISSSFKVSVLAIGGGALHRGGGGTTLEDESVLVIGGGALHRVDYKRRDGHNTWRRVVCCCKW